jgi:signal transduction histidine kinase
MSDDAGMIAGAVTVLQDISTLRDLERQRDHLLATVTHDLRNPLTGISGMSQLLQSQLDYVDEPVRERFARSLRSIESAAARMTSQVGELLDYAQTQVGRPPALALEPTDVVGLVRRVLEEHRLSTDRHTLELHVTDEVIVVPVDARRFARAIANLVVNAIKYSPQGGPVVVSVERAVGPDGQWLSIQVSDSGLGIPKTDFPHMFEPYYRASNVASTIPGTGIGLAGVRNVVQKHGGTVTLDSTEGVGTTVTVRLSMHPDAGAQAGAVS